MEIVYVKNKVLTSLTQSDASAGKLIRKMKYFSARPTVREKNHWWQWDVLPMQDADQCSTRMDVVVWIWLDAALCEATWAK